MNVGHLKQALPLWAAVLPLVTFNVCYLVAISVDHLPACITYLSGCTSVSSTGRQLPESVIFRAGMLPSAAIALLVWWHSSAFVRGGQQSSSIAIAIRVTGVTSALSLVLYALTVGLPGDEIRSVRRIGINGFALSNSVAQLLFVIAYRRRGTDVNRRLLRWLMASMLALPTIGIVSEAAKSLGVERHMANNIAAWNAFLMLSAFYFVLYKLWRHHTIPDDLAD